MIVKGLMIGDWVRIKKNVPDDAYFMHDDMFRGMNIRVDEILSNGINPDWIGGEINDFLPDDAIEPIPITAEILEKNGWYIGELDLWYRHPEVQFLMALRTSGAYLYADEEHDKREFFCVIQSVHELQHALRICGIDKEIKL